MTHTAFKRWIATWWVCAALIIYFGYQIKVNAQTFSTGLTIVTATASSDLTVSYY